MFRRKRNILFRRLWRCRVSKTTTDLKLNNDHDAARSSSILPLSSSSSSICSESSGARLLDKVGNEQLKQILYSLLKSLTIKQLESLVKCIESRGGIKSNCIVTTSKVRVPLNDGTSVYLQFHILLCCIFRWPDMVGEDYELKRLTTCTAAIGGDANNLERHTEIPLDHQYICVNPHHYSHLCLHESVPPPYTIYQLNDSPTDYQEEDSSSNPSSVVSIDSAAKSLDECSSYSSIRKTPFGTNWCAIAYWEFRERVGRMFMVEESTVNVFQELPEGEGFWLGALNRNVETVKTIGSTGKSNQCLGSGRVFGRIGYGLQLSREDDSIWVYNRSEHPIYVNSPLYNRNTLSIHNTEVKKVQPGYSLKIFDYSKISTSQQQLRSHIGPADPYSIRISFVKGWGRNYARQFVASCPCWLEVLLNVWR